MVCDAQFMFMQWVVSAMSERCNCTMASDATCKIIITEGWRSVEIAHGCPSRTYYLQSASVVKYRQQNCSTRYTHLGLHIVQVVRYIARPGPGVPHSACSPHLAQDATRELASVEICFMLEIFGGAGEYDKSGSSLTICQIVIVR